MKKIAVVLAVVSLFLTVMAPYPALAAQEQGGAGGGTGCSDAPILGITKWYRGLQESDGSGGCRIKKPDSSSMGMGKFITMIILNLIQAAMAVAGYVAVFFIIKGGFNYMTSTGSPDGMTKARKTITNSVIGLIIVLLSAGIVNAIAGAL